MYGAFSYLFVILMGFAGVGDALKLSFGNGNESHKEEEAILMEKEGWDCLYVILLY